MSARRVVVTGGCGFVGGHLVQRLVTRGDAVTVFDGAAQPPDLGAAVREHARFVTGDIRDPDAVAALVRPGIDAVYHLAAVVGVDQYLSRPLDVIDTNFLGTRNVLRSAARTGARVVVASTSEIFGKNPKVPWSEDGDRVLGPTTTDRWAYSSSKALAEHLTFAFVRQHGLPATVVRYFNVYGPRQRPAYLVSRSVHRALNGLPPVVYDRGAQTRCLTYVSDTVAGTVLAGEREEAIGTAFNLGNTRETTVYDVISLISELVGAADPVTEVDTADKLGPSYQDLGRRVPDTGRARSLLGWECRTQLRKGLVETIEWARANPWWLALPDRGA
ncbi:NAD-dependent epimerase/dehydratase family protein [Rhizomonospora bruguierae]|uniref:NAD-dependent epimerase/dehydratase family protein n=1 Tax=Rhizomonospora bruguierae TaxID=1581705 RepID=UPI001BCCB088|nr:NAD-dependent epimerase/dehydratase family protein [Micromonospora sp. NBRC 107566]